MQSKCRLTRARTPNCNASTCFRDTPPLDMSMRREAASERLITRSFIVGLAFILGIVGVVRGL